MVPSCVTKPGSRLPWMMVVLHCRPTGLGSYRIQTHHGCTEMATSCIVQMRCPKTPHHYAHRESKHTNRNTTQKWAVWCVVVRTAYARCRLCAPPFCWPALPHPHGRSTFQFQSVQLSLHRRSAHSPSPGHTSFLKMYQSTSMRLHLMTSQGPITKANVWSHTGSPVRLHSRVL